MTELVPIDAAPPSGDDLIELLEETLEKARAGKLSSLALAVVYRDGSTGDGWSNQPSMSAQLGAVTALQFRLARNLVEKNE